MKENILFKTVNTNGIYSCEGLDITVEEWKKVLQDSAISNKQKLWLVRFYQEPEHKASCKFMGEKFSCSYTDPRENIKTLGIATEKILSRFEVQGTDGEKTYWVIPMKQGRYVNGNFEWTMRDELVQAMEELDMTDPEKFEGENKLNKIVNIYKKLLDEDPDFAFFDEEYKWQMVTKCKGKADLEIFKFLVKGKSNLFDNFSIRQAEKDFLDDSVINKIFESLFDEGEKLDDRVVQYKKDIKENSEQGKNRIINSERDASVFLTCKYPEKYVFYKPSYYVKYCKYLDIPDMSFGTRLTHYLELISDIEKVILQDEELLSKMESLTSKYYQSSKLIAQNILYVLFDKSDCMINSEGETQMENPQDKLISETKNLLENTKNLILTGAPGTGKTYLAKQIAKAMGCTDNEIGFVQFHQSYDYTDFVEGLRPVQNDSDNQIGFERKDGVFKEFCGKALKNLVDSRKSVEEIAEETDIQTEVDSFLLNAIDTQRTFKTLSEREFYILNFDNNRIEIKIPSNEKYNNVTIRYNELINLLNMKKEINQVSDIRAVFFRKVVIQSDSYLYILYKSILSVIIESKRIQKNISQMNQIQRHPFVFIIDEINRGEVSKIFGELFYCVDPGYRGERGRINTQYQNLISGGEFQKGFFIPENIYIIGTMNDIDRSVESMDFAFRRRFAWKEISANDTQYMLDEVEKDGVIYGLSSDIAEEAKERMDRLNDEISKVPELNSAYHIGACYFLKLKNYEDDSDNGFQSLWNYHLKGILEEYLRGNPEKADLMKKLKAAYDGEDVTNEG